jgi:hypothetical protein
MYANRIRFVGHGFSRAVGNWKIGAALAADVLEAALPHRARRTPEATTSLGLQRLNSLRKKAFPGVIPSEARNLSALNAKKKRDSSSLGSSE